MLTVTTPDRLLFSTDYPFQQPTPDEITTFLDVFPDADRALFTTRHAAALIGLDL